MNSFMKKDLLIIVSRILQGGIDNVLVEYLKQFDRTKFNIRLAIVTCMEEHEVCINDIPDDVEIHYLVKKHFLVKYRKMRAVRKMPLHKKIYDEALLNPIRRIIQKKAFDKLVRMSDVVIEFDSSSQSWLKGVSIHEIAFFHFSFSKYHNGNKRKLKRLGKKLDVSDKIATICDEMKNEGIRMYPDLQKKFVMIYNAFDFEVIRKKSLDIVESPLIEQPTIVAVHRLEDTQKHSS